MRAHLRRVARVKEQTAGDERAQFSELEVGERIAEGLRHSQQVLDAFAGSSDAEQRDDSVEVGVRVAQYLRARRA